MRKDKFFKNNFMIKGFVKRKYSKLYYNPDLYFENDNEVVFVEHSSTGDRKVHIGELYQFIVVKCELPKSMILVLDGVGKDAPTVKGEKARLRHYFQSDLNNFKKNIEFIGVVKNKKSISGLSFEELKEKCEVVYDKRDVKHYKNININK